MGSPYKSSIDRREFLKQTALAGVAGMTGVATAVAGRGVSIVCDPSDAIASKQPVRWAIGELKRSFATSGIPVRSHQRIEQAGAGDGCIVVASAEAQRAREILKSANVAVSPAPEAIALVPAKAAGRFALLVCGGTLAG